MRIIGKDIYMTRGDSETITIYFRDPDNNQVPLSAGDKIYFTVKKDIRQTEKEIQKIITEFPDGKIIIEIKPEDTKVLSFGWHTYDIQLNRASGSVTTLIPPSAFILGGEVTYE